ncbi:MAG: DNA-binding protein, partial [Halobacteriales archaeon]|nr:DNA-binding protein [Halobacteriales archaeon]
MSDAPDEERLEELRRQKLQELQEGGGEGAAADPQAQEEAKRQADAQKQAILRQYLTDDARKR